MHPEAQFDHELYCQTDTPLEWEESEELNDDKVELRKAQGILVAGKSCYRVARRGIDKNADVYRAA